MDHIIFIEFHIIIWFILTGAVPVYLGDSAHLKYLLPETSAAIYVSDFQNISSLVEYLTFLSSNETAYEYHRAWRSRFSYESNVRDKPILKTSWFCRICQWAGELKNSSLFLLFIFLIDILIFVTCISNVINLMYFKIISFT